MKYYGINATAKTTGITESTLRRWEATGFFTAERVCMGNAEVRIYSAVLVDFLKRIKNLIDSGMRVRAAFEYLDE
ncbi:MAG: MerR family transcriptional regulator [Desulfomonilaceae bacterium]